MRADEAITIGDVEYIGEIQAADYINQLRYERLMAKALFLKELKHNGDYFYSSVGSKTWEEIEMQLSRISRAYEARAKRIKEEK